MRSSQFVKNLMMWRGKNNLDFCFPWRNAGDPYKVLIAEILLKKTTRKQVANQWFKFIKKYPDFNALKNAKTASLLKVLRPLGLEHVRAKQLKRLASVIVSEFSGKIPSDQDKLLSLPGVGRYSANAVLSFIFNYDISMIDANTARVLQRVFGLKSKKKRPRADNAWWTFAESLPPKGKGKEFNYGILDFASEICTAKNPKCSICPMSKICSYYKHLAS